MTTFSIFFLVSLLFAASAAPSALGFVINGTTIIAVRISGTLYCTPNGNPRPGAAGAAGATVTLQFPFAGPTVRPVLTDDSGNFHFLLNNVDFFDPRSCVVVVDLPIKFQTAVGCTALPPTGSLNAWLNLVALLETKLGVEATFTSGPWIPPN